MEIHCAINLTVTFLRMTFIQSERDSTDGNKNRFIVCYISLEVVVHVFVTFIKQGKLLIFDVDAFDFFFFNKTNPQNFYIMIEIFLNCENITNNFEK